MEKKQQLLTCESKKLTYIHKILSSAKEKKNEIAIIEYRIAQILYNPKREC